MSKDIIDGANLNKSGVYPGWKAMAQAEHDKITIEPLTVTENDTYTAPPGKAYSPVTVNVEGGGGSDRFTSDFMILDSDVTCALNPESPGMPPYGYADAFFSLNYYPYPDTGSYDVEWDGVWYRNVHTLEDQNDIIGAEVDYDNPEQTDWSVYPFQISTTGVDIVTPDEGTHSVKIVLKYSIKKVRLTIINNDELFDPADDNVSAALLSAMTVPEFSSAGCMLPQTGHSMEIDLLLIAPDTQIKFTNMAYGVFSRMTVTGDATKNSFNNSVSFSSDCTITFNPDSE